MCGSRPEERRHAAVLAALAKAWSENGRGEGRQRAPPACERGSSPAKGDDPRQSKGPSLRLQAVLWKWSNPRLGATIREDCVPENCVRPLSRRILVRMRALKKKARAEKLRSWSATLMRSRAQLLGIVYARDEKSAEAAAVAEFKIGEKCGGG